MHHYDRPRRALAFGVAALAGFVDATGFLAADGYFVSFMSGNTTRLGVDLGTRTAAALTPALLILAFLCGVIAGAVTAERSPRRRKTAVLALSACLIGIAAIGHAFGAIEVFLGGSVLAMGVVNNAFRREDGAAVGVTYMTGALVRFGQGVAARLTGKPFDGGGAGLMLWTSLALGALAGTLATSLFPSLAPWMPLLAALALLAAAGRIESASA